MKSPFEEFLTAWQTALTQHESPRIVLCAPEQLRNATDVPRKQSLRPIELRGDRMLQWELQFEKLQTHLNLSPEDSVARFKELFGEVYREAYLLTSQMEYMLRQTKTGAKLTRKTTPAKLIPLPLGHNRSKNYLIPEGQPCPFLEALGIMTTSGRVRESRQKKFRQINRYLEMINDIYPQLPADGELCVVDFGCGLSYLTFAVHYLLTEIHQRQVALYGIDQKREVIQRCQVLAEELQLQGMTFSTGTIEEAPDMEKVHLALSLHACDTATDAALAYSVKARADVILAVPCCQHEVLPQIANEELDLILQHGILKERMAALATDALRAAALDAVGYKSQVMEFIDLEHTPKNLLIRAIRRSTGPNEHAASSYHELKRILRINQLSTDQVFQQAETELTGSGVLS